jgi:hypothetical protein
MLRDVDGYAIKLSELDPEWFQPHSEDVVEATTGKLPWLDLPRTVH